jgi:nicotinate-nucleotide adenylyltransferase
MRIGILGGTFDPPHIGHLILAEQARVQLKLDEVWFVPAGQPVHKSDQVVSAAKHRVAMVRLAIKGHAHFKLCLVDVERPGPHYSLDLVNALRQQFPRNTWRFIIGADSLADLRKWHKPDELVRCVRLAAARRPGFQPDVAALEHVIPNLRQRLTWISTPTMDIASRDLRARLRKGLSVRYVVPSAVVAYVKQKRLYMAR